ncbi:MAG TPA: riboflavin synthase [Flavobacteriales bacterium]|jgi:riboflavin synthase|nr:riboflavin synthase [Flavobacteriales bacterium]HAW18986.1 riboflavin synthase [Flavobacteriales bacterium]
MFTGIVETLGQIQRIEKEGTNVHFWIESEITSELQIDQSVAHNGVCLTVIEIGESYCVTAIEETLNKTSLGGLKQGSAVNLERCLKSDGRFDGHIVQGHVDTTAVVVDINDRGGSWNFSFELDQPHNGLIVEKGSICLNGVSLTVVNVGERSFSVSIIPYTYEHTGFRSLSVNERINVEFDILGKYVAASIGRLMV